MDRAMQPAVTIDGDGCGLHASCAGPSETIPATAGAAQPADFPDPTGPMTVELRLRQALRPAKRRAYNRAAFQPEDRKSRTRRPSDATANPYRGAAQGCSGEGRGGPPSPRRAEGTTQGREGFAP